MAGELPGFLVQWNDILRTKGRQGAGEGARSGFQLAQNLGSVPKGPGITLTLMFSGQNEPDLRDLSMREAAIQDCGD